MKNSNQINVPQAREAMDKFKMLIRPGGVNLKQGYNGGLTFRESGDLSGQMVKEGVSHANSVSKKQPHFAGTYADGQVHSRNNGLTASVKILPQGQPPQI